MNEADDARSRIERLTNAQPPGEGLSGTAQTLHQLCCAAARDLPASGVAISLLGASAGSEMAAASDPVSARVEELQFTLGEGPCRDALTSRRPVLTSDLRGSGRTRWPVYASAAAELGVRAVFAVPLAVGDACLGALDVYRTHTGPLSPAALAEAVDFAAYATAILLHGQEQAGADQPPPGLDDVLSTRFEVYQAQGMLTVQLGVGLEEALLRLRAHAFAMGLSLVEVSRDVLSGTLVLQRDQP
ncbi:MAG: GAF and ANTAR domain-containing protein [Actinomycetales bacterium]|nr:GAF and ANTAR domain-containing protein [Actinomycetales bacterium]